MDEPLKRCEKIEVGDIVEINDPLSSTIHEMWALVIDFKYAINPAQTAVKLKVLHQGGHNFHVQLLLKKLTVIHKGNLER
jgi:hypothetical protein